MKLGNESSYHFRNILIKSYISTFGPLGINAKIRSSHLINAIYRHERITGYKNLKVLDAGCGLAYTDFFLAGKYPNWKIKGIDANTEVIEKNVKLSNYLGLTNLEFEKKSIEDIYDRDCYDIIISADVLEHIYEDVMALQKLRNAIQKNGLLILHLPLNRHLCSRIIPFFKPIVMEDHVREEYTLEDILDKLRQTYFHPIEVGYSYSWKGELAYELNYLFIRDAFLRRVFAVLFHFPSNLLGYLDSKSIHSKGNSIVIVAKPK